MIYLLTKNTTLPVQPGDTDARLKLLLLFKTRLTKYDVAWLTSPHYQHNFF